jgi:hypothetical protein
VHFHAVIPEGVFTPGGAFHPMSPPDDEEVTAGYRPRSSASRAASHFGARLRLDESLAVEKLELEARAATSAGGDGALKSAPSASRTRTAV